MNTGFGYMANRKRPNAGTASQSGVAAKKRKKVHTQSSTKKSASQKHILTLIKCSICPTSSPTWCRNNSAFQRHMVTHNKKHKPFKCSKCEKGFARYDACLKHEQIHIKERKKFSCNICGAEFTTKCYVPTHIKLVHKNSSSSEQNADKNPPEKIISSEVNESDDYSVEIISVNDYESAENDDESVDNSEQDADKNLPEKNVLPSEKQVEKAVDKLKLKQPSSKIDDCMNSDNAVIGVSAPSNVSSIATNPTISSTAVTSRITGVLKDDLTVFGEFIASEMRQIESGTRRQELKRTLTKFVFDVADEVE